MNGRERTAGLAALRAFFRWFYRALGTALILSRAERRAPVWSRSVRLRAKLSHSLARCHSRVNTRKPVENPRSPGSLCGQVKACGGDTVKTQAGVRQFLGQLIAKLETSPKYLVTDSGPQFTSANFRP